MDEDRKNAISSNESEKELYFHKATTSHFLAQSSSATYSDLRRLSHHAVAQIRVLIAKRNDIPRHLLAKLACDSDPQVRLAVAVNSRTPTDCLKKLADDESIVLRFGFVSEMNISEDVLLALSRQENPYIRRQACLALERRELQQMLEQEGFIEIPGQTHKIGTILVEAGLATREDLEEAAAMAALHRMKIGEAIVQSGILMKEIVCSYLLEQSRLRMEKSDGHGLAETSKEP